MVVLWLLKGSNKSFLKCSGTNGPISGDVLNPTNTKNGGGTLAKQFATLTINIAFSNNPQTGFPEGFGNLYYSNPGDSLDGKTVN